MVTLNGTLVVELVLFLVFLWGVHRLVFRPTFDVMDKRAATMEEDRKAAKRARYEADTMEQEYRQAISAVRHHAQEHLRLVRQKAQNAAVEKISEQKRAADKEVESVRQVAAKHIAGQREQFDRLTPELAEVIRVRLSLGAANEEVQA